MMDTMPAAADALCKYSPHLLVVCKPDNNNWQQMVEAWGLLLTRITMTDGLLMADGHST
jgi:hypothetical protein